MSLSRRQIANRLADAPLGLRLAAAFGLFVGVLGTTLWLANRAPRADSVPASSTSMTASTTSVGPFYGAIGVSTLPSQTIDEDEIPVGESYTVELAIVATANEADATLDELARKGVRAFYTPVTRDGRVFFRIRKGFFGNEAIAREALADLDRQRIRGKVVRLK